MFTKLGAQLYTIRDHIQTPDDFRASLKKLKSIGYDQIDTAGYPIPIEDMARIAKEENVEVVCAQNDFNFMCEHPEEMIKQAQLLGTSYIGVGGVDWSNYATRESTLAFCDKINNLCKAIKPHGIKFTYHNHSPEFKKFETGETVFDLLINNTDPEAATFMIDTYWIQYGGGDLYQFLENLKGRIDIIHLKDTKVTFWDPEVCEIGEGNFVWDKIFKIIDEIGVKTLVVEQDCNWQNDDPFASLKISADYLAKFLNK